MKEDSIFCDKKCYNNRLHNWKVFIKRAKIKLPSIQCECSLKKKRIQNPDLEGTFLSCNIGKNGKRVRRRTWKSFVPTSELKRHQLELLRLFIDLKVFWLRQNGWIIFSIYKYFPANFRSSSSRVKLSRNFTANFASQIS